MVGENNTTNVARIISLADPCPAVQLGRIVEIWQSENLSLLVGLVNPTPPLLFNLGKSAFHLSNVILLTFLAAASTSSETGVE